MEKTSLVAAGVARSGLHPVGLWIANQTDSPSVYYNSIGPNLQASHMNRFGDGNPSLIVYGLENFDLRGWREIYGMEAFDGIILINRSPKNWLASSLKSGGRLAKVSKAIGTKNRFSKWTNRLPRRQLWKQYVRESLGETNFINQEVTTVNYDKWHTNEEYRRHFCESNSLKFTDKWKDRISHRGEGSSFSGARYDGQAHKLGVLNRWEFFKNNSRFQELLDDEMLKLWEKYN